MSKRITDRAELATSGLAIAAEKEFGPHCPCCGHPMKVPRGRKALANCNDRDRRTIAHDFPVGSGGSQKVWVYACRGCNSDQGMRTFWLWANALDKAGDRRAERVYALARFIRSYRIAYREARDNGHFD